MGSSSDEEDFAPYGNPLDPIDEDDVPKKKPITIEDQYATDEHGRRRFHGAFTGGFTAGFGNSVGSLEGWQPSDFRSTRNSRTETKTQSVFDFMDEEDRSQHGICPMSIKVKPLFNDKTAESSIRKRAREVASEGPIPGVPVAHQLFTPVRDTIGVKLLMKMGWRPGQGVGPRITRKEKKLKKKQADGQKVYGCSLPLDAVRSVDDESSDSDVDINFEELTFAPDDYKPYVAQPKQNAFGLGYKGIDRKPVLSSERASTSKLTVNGKTIRGQAFGVSVFEEDDDDIYTHDDMSNYDFSLGPERKTTKSRFDNAGCIEGFHQAAKPTNVREKFPLPIIPNDFVPLKSRKFRWGAESKPEPKKKITNIADRVKIIDDSDVKKEVEEKVVEAAAVKLEDIELPPEPNTSIKPFINDKDKQSRYDRFLMFKKLGFRDGLATIQPPTMTEWEKERERSEFEQVARLYRPLSHDMADRFTSGGFQDVHNILEPVAKTTNSANQAMEEAAKKKMYGVLTRRKFSWIPERILCKRFNIPEPELSSLEKSIENTKSKPHKSASIFEFLKSEVNMGRTRYEEPEEEKLVPHIKVETEPVCSSLDQSDNLAQHTKLPDESDEPVDEVPDVTDKADLFKAIFLSSSESEGEEEEEESDLPASSIEKFEQQLMQVDEERRQVQYSPPRGIFANLDLDSLRSKLPPKTDPNDGISSKEDSCGTESQSRTANDNPCNEQDSYGPKLPTTCMPVRVNKGESVEKNKKSREVWVEKSHKVKKHKKHKKHKKTKHKEK